MTHTPVLILNRDDLPYFSMMVESYRKLRIDSHMREIEECTQESIRFGKFINKMMLFQSAVMSQYRAEQKALPNPEVQGESQ